MARPYPFTAIVGQEDMKRALLVAAVDPAIGGVMVFGDRGTGKSTIVRALADLLPEIEIVAGSLYNQDPAAPFAGYRNCGMSADGGAAANAVERIPVPVVDMPLGATEDRVVGALDLERALTAGEKEFEPGLLARAHRGFLYIDEINLLEDHLVDLLLDVAASGENIVEREGISVRHPSRFVLIGSGNPEEGELRPQLLDRFGLSVDVTTPNDLGARVEVVRRRMAYEADRDAFAAEFDQQNAAVRENVLAARARLEDTRYGVDVVELAARLCMALGTDGLRGELTLTRAARAVAALEGATAVTPEQLRAVAPSALRHRLRRNPLDDTGSTVRVERALDELFAG